MYSTGNRLKCITKNIVNIYIIYICYAPKNVLNKTSAVGKHIINDIKILYILCINVYIIYLFVYNVHFRIRKRTLANS